MIVLNARFLTQKITGVQRYAIEMSKKLKEFDDSIVFVSPSNIIHNDIAEDLDVLKIGKLKGHLWEQIELPLFLRRNGSPLLVSLANTAPVFYRNKIVTVHDLAFERHPEWFSKKFSILYKILIPRVCRNSCKLITDSEHSKTEILELYKIPNGKVEVVHVAPSKIFKPYIEKKDCADKYILAVSSIDPRKNFRRLIEAFNLLENTEYKLMVVGGSNNLFSNDSCDDLEVANVEFLGYVSDEELVELYRRAYMFVYPSLYEGFGLPPIEAMACGCPVITSDVASLPEVCGDACIYVDPFSSEDIAKAMQTLLLDESLRCQLINKGRARGSFFSWEKSARQLLNIIKENAE